MNTSTDTLSDSDPKDCTLAEAAPQLRLTGISKSFRRPKGGTQQILSDVSCEIGAGEFVAVIGPSGSGKSTLLRILAGLETPDRGQVTLTGQPVTRPSRRMGMVFQQHVLLPWLSAKGNVLFALDAAGGSARSVGTSARSAGEREAIADKWLDRVGLSEAADLKPHQLSGGMAQRVGIARAFALDSEVLLLDEPLGALDALTRYALQQQLLELSEHEKRTFVLVTHDVDEALLLADRILVLSHGPSATIQAELDVPFARPRDRDAIEADPAFLELRRELHHALTPETTD
ncbi:ABC transporter ATP-binding protein [Brevibacterium spongiae]|uniref:ABC transporter ATP-binding protein n=1 Tax=Brevibacterium spongiae TaxID=2909672 RepID=A0ABY5SRF5_9MICO|nr:ABC transporter ATP-binding protein [Brevibacterium spongiae]UVI36725.1 ABC transporter ATP-binding protein [Brevibacterium spongiae]